MRTIRKTGVTALTAGIALALGAVPVALTVPSILASSESVTTLTPGSETPTFEEGTLTIGTNSAGGSVSWSGSAETQTFTGGQFCDLTSGGADLLDFGGTLSDDTRVGLAGFGNGSIGVFEQSNASQCFRVDANSFTDYETLVLELGDDLVDSQGRGLEAAAASLDLEMRSKDVKIVAEASNGATSEKFTLLTGSFRSGAVDGVDTTSRARTGQNVQWSIQPEKGFNKLTLTAIGGGFSLEGGADSDSDGPTTFTLLGYGDDFFCGDGDNEYVEDGVTVKYLGNADGSECKGFGVRLDKVTDREVQFLKPLSIDPSSQFVFEIPWTLSNSSPALDLPTAQINFDPEDDNVFWDMEFCPEFLYTDGVLTGLDASSSEADRAALEALDMEKAVNGVDSNPGTQFACIDDPRVVTVGGTNATLTDTIYLTGDARMRL